MQSRPIEMAVYFIDTAIHYQNRTNPLPPYINYVKKGLDLNFIKTTEISISTILVVSCNKIFQAFAHSSLLVVDCSLLLFNKSVSQKYDYGKYPIKS